MDHPEPCIVLIAIPSEPETRLIAETLVREGLAACCSRVPGMRSWYTWQETFETAEECLLICKTFTNLFERLESRVRALHSYEVPEIIAVPMTAASAPYLAWMKEMVTDRGS